MAENFACLITRDVNIDITVNSFSLATQREPFHKESPLRKHCLLNKIFVYLTVVELHQSNHLNYSTILVVFQIVNFVS